MAKLQEVVLPDGATVHRKPVAGDLQWNGQVWRRWSGRKWTRAVYACDPARLEDPTLLSRDPAVSPERQRRALELAVEDQVTHNGASVVFDGPHGVVLSYRRPVSHGMHAGLTVVTAGLWALVWVVAAVSRREDRVRLEVDRWGAVWGTPGQSA